jgi:hypothetical protein
MRSIARWLDERRREPPEWRRVTGFSDRMLYLTAEELADLDRKVWEVIDAEGYEKRLDDPAARPPDSRPISVIVFGIPTPAPGS